MISTRCNGLDEVCGGGIHIGKVTELYGLSGAGKTQLCMQLALSAQLRPAVGSAGKSIFFVVKTFPARRLHEIASYMPFTDLKQVLQNVLIFHVYSPHEFTDALDKVNNYLAENPLETNSTDIIVIDSIYAIFKDQFPNTYTGMIEKTNMLKSIAYALDRMAKKYNVAIVVCNNDGFANHSIASSSRAPPTALAKSWMKYKRQTYYLYRQWVAAQGMWVHKFIKTTETEDREILGQCNFTITASGVNSIDI